MKNILLIAALFALVLSGGTTAFSMEREIGGKTGFMLVDESGADDIIPIGIVYSQTLDTVAPNLWLEGEFNYGLLGGDYDRTILGTKYSGEIDIWTIAAYAAYRHPLSRDAYLKGKVGLLYESIDVDISGWSDSDTDLGLSLGIGGGFKMSDRMTGEVEFTIIEEDVNFLSFAIKVPLD